MTIGGSLPSRISTSASTMLIIAAAAALFAAVILVPAPALAWGPVTHIALGVQVLATVITPDHPLQAVLLNLPEVFLYGSLAPDIVQGRRLTSRLRRHSHNWATGLGLLESAQGVEQVAFAAGYLSHLATDVIAHNFYLPARFIGRFEARIASHIYAEARYDSFQDRDYHQMLASLMAANFHRLDAMLDRAVDSPLVPFSAHRRVFEGGLKRMRQWNAIIKAFSPVDGNDEVDQKLFSETSCAAVHGVFNHGEQAPACSFDPMGTKAVRSALASRRNLQRLTRISAAARTTARELAGAMVRDLHEHLRKGPFRIPEVQD